MARHDKPCRGRSKEESKLPSIKLILSNCLRTVAFLNAFLALSPGLPKSNTLKNWQTSWNAVSSVSCTSQMSQLFASKTRELEEHAISSVILCDDLTILEPNNCTTPVSQMSKYQSLWEVAESWFSCTWQRNCSILIYTYHIGLYLIK